MQFVVPQFIEVESKVIGPISVRQFIILLITAGLMWLGWTVLSFWIACVVDIFIFGIGGTFAFVKVNSQPFHIFALSFIQTIKSPRLKVWGKEMPIVVKAKEKKEKVSKVVAIPKPELTRSRLSELSLMVDTGGVYQQDENNKNDTRNAR